MSILGPTQSRISPSTLEYTKITHLVEVRKRRFILLHPKVGERAVVVVYRRVARCQSPPIKLAKVDTGAGCEPHSLLCPRFHSRTNHFHSQRDTQRISTKQSQLSQQKSDPNEHFHVQNYGVQGYLADKKHPPARTTIGP